MTSLRQEIRQHLRLFLESHENEETPEELLRMVQNEAWLLRETEELKTTIKSDPYECLKELNPSTLKRLLELLHVTDCHRVHTPSGYCKIHAVCRIDSDVRMKTRGVTKGIDLEFVYERHPAAEEDANTMKPPSVSYCINLSKDHGASEKLLWVHAYAGGQFPNPHAQAINMDEDNEDEWEDMDEEAEDTGEDLSNKHGGTGGGKADAMLGKRSYDGIVQRAPSNFEMKNGENEGDKDQEMQDSADRFYAGLDPDVLGHFLHWSHLSGELEDDAASFYLIMTFPYYENEFDLLGYLLEAVFGSDEDENNDSD